MEEGVEAIAARCLEDGAFARQLLVGEDDAEVRNAIIADLDAESELNPQPLPPDEGFSLSPWVKQVRIWDRWDALPRENLKRLAGR